MYDVGLGFQIDSLCMSYALTIIVNGYMIFSPSDGGAPGPGGHPGGGDPWGMTNTSLPGGSYPSSSMLPSSAQYSQASSYPMGHRDSMVSYVDVSLY